MNRDETRENNFGIKYKLGQKFKLYKNFGKSDGDECHIVDISPSGLSFKVNTSDEVFSTKTLQSNGSTLTSGYYLTAQ